jgi:hypothetical protein
VRAVRGCFPCNRSRVRPCRGISSSCSRVGVPREGGSPASKPTMDAARMAMAVLGTRAIGHQVESGGTWRGMKKNSPPMHAEPRGCVRVEARPSRPHDRVRANPRASAESFFSCWRANETGPRAKSPFKRSARWAGRCRLADSRGPMGVPIHR